MLTNCHVACAYLTITVSEIFVKLIKRDALCQRQLCVLVAVRKLLAAINAREKLRAYINPHTLLLIAAAADEYTRSEYNRCV